MLHIIIVNWNGSSDTLDCVNSILEGASEGIDVVVVDNGSEKSQTDFVRSALSDKENVHVVETGANLGFSGGNNAGIRFAIERGILHDKDFVLFLNNDTTVQKGFHAPLLEAFKSNEKLGVAQPLILYDYDRNLINSFGQVYSKNGLAFSPFRGKKRSIIENTEIPTPLSLVSGCAFCTRAEIVFEVMNNSPEKQFWDEDYFLYGEDVELSLRIRSLGYEALGIANSVIFHKEGVSTKKLSRTAMFHSYKNITQTYLISFEALELAKLLPYLFAMELISIPYTLTKGTFPIWIKAKIWILRNYFKIIKKRKYNLSKKKTTLTSEFILKWLAETDGAQK